MSSPRSHLFKNLRRAAVAAILATSASASFATPQAAAYSCPGDPSPVWGCPGAFGEGKYDGIFNWKPGVTVIGDSLIQGLNSRLANQITSNGFWGHTYGVAGSAFYHWNNNWRGKDLGGWMQEFAPKHGVIALGTNDATALGSNPGVTRTAVSQQIAWGMERAWQGVTGCLIVVGPSRHNAYPSNAKFVRDQMAFRIWTTHNDRPAGHRMVWLDWDAVSANHPEWFIGANDPHFTASGNVAYSNAITSAVIRANINGC